MGLAAPRAPGGWGLRPLKSLIMVPSLLGNYFSKKSFTNTVKSRIRLEFRFRSRTGSGGIWADTGTAIFYAGL